MAAIKGYTSCLAGGIDPEETPEAASLRELEEETGYVGQNASYLGLFYSNNRRSPAKIHVILITDPVLGVKSGGDPDESIEPLWVEIGELRQMIARGEISNNSILAGLSLYDNRTDN
jgi:ADP-ribose pyrophosphatase